LLGTGARLLALERATQPVGMIVEPAEHHILHALAAEREQDGSECGSEGRVQEHR
jgi:hypothetical protein